MAEIDELRDILSPDESASDSPDESTDSLAATAPPDGEQPEDSDDTPEPESDELSAEERVDQLLRAEGDEDEPEDDDEADTAPEAAVATEPDDADLQELIAEGRRAREARQQQEQLAPYYEVYSAAEQRIAHGKAHYASERRRIRAAVVNDSLRSPDPEAYVETHLDAAIDGVIHAEEAWVAGIAQDARTRVQAIREQQSLPAWAAELARRRHLPKEAIPKIMTVGDPRQMAAMADLLVEARNALATERRKRTQAERSQAAQRISTQQVHAGASGRPASAREPELKGDIHELAAIMNAK
jgi:hypothetical protein